MVTGRTITNFLFISIKSACRYPGIHPSSLFRKSVNVAWLPTNDSGLGKWFGLHVLGSLSQSTQIAQRGFLKH